MAADSRGEELSKHDLILGEKTSEIDGLWIQGIPTETLQRMFQAWHTPAYVNNEESLRITYQQSRFARRRCTA